MFKEVVVGVQGEYTTLNYARRERQSHPTKKEGQVLWPEGTIVQGKEHAHCIGERPLVVQSLSLQDAKLRPGEV